MKTSLENLHFIWDSAGGLYQTEPPLSTSGKKELIQNATSLMQLHPRQSFTAELANGLNFSAWHEEAYDIAISVAYNVQYDTVPTTEYLLAVQNASKKLLALAGCVIR